MAEEDAQVVSWCKAKATGERIRIPGGFSRWPPPPPHFLDGIGTEKLAGNNAFFHLFFFLRSSSSFFSFSLSFSYFRKKKERKKEKFEIPHSYVFFCVLLRACMCLVGGGGVG